MDRRAAMAIALSLAGVPFLLPHVLEDFERGIARRIGLAPDSGAALLGLGLAVQWLGLVLAARGRRLGLVITAIAGAVWTAGALWDHGPELFSRGVAFRDSARSALWVTGLIITQVLSCALAVAALTRDRPRARGG